MNILGMNCDNGSIITNEKIYLQQSIQDIINTPTGSRVMRRNYGCDIMNIIDSPMNEYTLIQIQAYLANSLLQQEKNILLNKLTINSRNERLFIDIEGTYIQSGNKINISDVEIN